MNCLKLQSLIRNFNDLNDKINNQCTDKVQRIQTFCKNKTKKINTLYRLFLEKQTANRNAQQQLWNIIQLLKSQTDKNQKKKKYMDSNNVYNIAIFHQIKVIKYLHVFWCQQENNSIGIVCLSQLNIFHVNERYDVPISN